MKLEERDDLVIIDGFEIDCFIDEERHCSICKINLVYYEDFDAYFPRNAIIGLKISVVTLTVITVLNVL